MITYSLDNDNYKKKMAHFQYMEVCHHYFCYAICLGRQTERMLLVSDLNSSATVVRNW